MYIYITRGLHRFFDFCPFHSIFGRHWLSVVCLHGLHLTCNQRAFRSGNVEYGLATELGILTEYSMLTEHGLLTEYGMLTEYGLLTEHGVLAAMGQQPQLPPPNVLSMARAAPVSLGSKECSIPRSWRWWGRSRAVYRE